MVKFTARYNNRAHRILHKAHFALRLISCSEVFGGLYTVVVEYLDGETVWKSVEEGGDGQGAVAPLTLR